MGSVDTPNDRQPTTDASIEDIAAAWLAAEQDLADGDLLDREGRGVGHGFGVGCVHALTVVDPLRSRSGRRPDAGSGLSLEDRAGPLGVVDDECEHRPVAPSAEEEVAVDIHAGVGQLA